MWIKMEIITVNEEMLLIIIWQLKEEAYGFPIMKKVMEFTKKKISYGSLYNSLNNLAKKGYLTYSKESLKMSKEEKVKFIIPSPRKE